MKAALGVVKTKQIWRKPSLIKYGTMQKSVLTQALISIFTQIATLGRPTHSEIGEGVNVSNNKSNVC